jgi:hypothetical protein
MKIKRHASAALLGAGFLTDKVTITLEPPKLTPKDVQKLKAAEARQATDK